MTGRLTWVGMQFALTGRVGMTDNKMDHLYMLQYMQFALTGRVGMTGLRQRAGIFLDWFLKEN